jgi:hypothetical protein
MKKYSILKMLRYGKSHNLWLCTRRKNGKNEAKGNPKSKFLEEAGNKSCYCHLVVYVVRVNCS